MPGWELYDTEEDWWIGISWGVGGHDAVSMDCPIPTECVEPYFS